MNTVSSILVHVDALPPTGARLELAVALARRLDATVTALYGAVPSVLQLTSPFPWSERSLQETWAVDQQRREQARAFVDAVRSDVSLRWAEVSPLQALMPTVARQAWLHDLVVMGQWDPSNASRAGVPADLVESVVIDSGRPVLVVPWAGNFADVGRRVVMAWKPVREAALALSAALPLLHEDASVHVVAWGDDPTEVRPLLLRHGIEAQYWREGPEAGHVGEYLLSRAADVGADLLVMGCYGHARARELALGGATRTVLGSMTLPVLMAH